MFLARKKNGIANKNQKRITATTHCLLVGGKISPVLDGLDQQQQT
jgi:hypothetical protein